METHHLDTDAEGSSDLLWATDTRQRSSRQVEDEEDDEEEAVTDPPHLHLPVVCLFTQQ